MADLLTIPFARSAYCDAVALATSYSAADADVLADLLELADEDTTRALLLLLIAALAAYCGDRDLPLEAALQALGLAAAELAASTPEDEP